GEILNTNSQTVFLKLINPWTVFAADKSLTLSAGTILVCYDEFATWDKDYNDFIFAISDTAPAGTTPTPIPGALWLLGSGLMGLMGIKRARKGQ
ncbi:MAG: VPLPA-CTERM sorting domain-containing protein, partial [Humidesulfovibrio sp.]|nr:VPLPA-CTERM sorting domain-containing protein [Humidesulfovibrio sp.]